FSGKGHVTFKKLIGKLAINGTNYTLVNSIASLAAAIHGKPSGDYALASNYDAGKDGTYSNSPIQTTFTGAFEGLGSAISNLTITVRGVSGQALPIALFAEIGTDGMASDLHLERANVSVQKLRGIHSSVSLGILAAVNEGSLSRISVSGSVAAPRTSWIGGLVGSNVGTISESSSAVEVNLQNAMGVKIAGSLVGLNQGVLVRSYAIGSVTEYSGSNSATAGLVGETYSTSQISDCYATGNASGNAAGGLIGVNDGAIENSYSTGEPSGVDGTGGLLGADGSATGSLTNTYWNTTTSGITNLSQGAGNIANDPGITGLTTQQLQSGLPAGFDPSIWGESANVNNGMPYLLANPPPK
ncbi:MAG TPA: GLUG motif-containing protein, partial [Rhizomicrobium sp.]